MIDRLLGRGVTLKVHDPEAMENVRLQYGDRLTYCHHRDDALAGADALAILTEWKHFVHPDFDAMRRLMRQPVIFDGRNLYPPQRMQASPVSPTTASAGRRCTRSFHRGRTR